jgi:nucleoside-triphosphatase THEP1
MPRWILIVGPKKSEKARYALELAGRLVRSGVAVGGFVQVRPASCDTVWTHEVERLTTGERLPLAREGSAERDTQGEAFCSKLFIPDVFSKARGWIEEDAVTAKVLFVGDVSKLEVSGLGHHASLVWAMAHDPIDAVVICARSDQLFYVVEKFNLEDDGIAWLELPIDDGAAETFYTSVVGSLSGAATRAPQPVTGRP